MTFGQNLRMVREGNQLTREQLALCCDMTIDEVHGIELDVFEPSLGGLHCLASVLQCSTDLLMYGPPDLQQVSQG